MYMTLLRNRNFLLLWLSQIASTLADQLYKIGVMVVIFNQTGSTLQATGVLVATSLPQVVMGPIAGALVDRYPRKQVLIAVELSRVLMVAFSLFLATGNTINVWLVYLVVAGLSISNTFYKPALHSMIPSIVDRSEIVHANSLVNSTNYGVMAVGYGVGGFLILRVGLSTIVGIDLALFLLAMLLVTRIAATYALTEPSAQKSAEPILRSIRDGMSYLRHHAIARSLITMEFLEHWPHAIWTSALMLAFTTEALQASEEFWGYQNAIYFGGNILGAVVAVAYASRLGQRPGWVIIINAFLMALLTVAYAVSSNLWWILVIMLLYGPPMALRDVAQDSLLQSTVEGGVLGRVYATRQMLAMFAFMVSGLILAWLADVVPVRNVYLLGAALYFVTAFYALAQRSLRQAKLEVAELATSGAATSEVAAD